MHTLSQSCTYAEDEVQSLQRQSWDEIIVQMTEEVLLGE